MQKLSSREDVCLSRIENARRLRLLQVITNFGQGGAQRVFHDHCRFLSQWFEITEVVFNEREDLAVYPTYNEVISLDVEAGYTAIQKVQRLRDRIRRLRSLIDKKAPSLVISHLDGANWVNVLSHTSNKKVLVLHGSVLRDQEVPPLMNWLRRKVLLPLWYNQADVTVAVSDGIKAELESCGVRNVVSIPNFFDGADIRQRAACGLPEPIARWMASNTVLITSGRLALPKQQAFLIKIFSQLVQQQPHLKLMLLGDGELRNELVELVNDLHLKVYFAWGELEFATDRQVYFMGYQSNPFAYLALGSLFLFPSGWEGFPMALCEAMICGIPVLASDCPTGPRQILAPGTCNTNYQLAQWESTLNGMLLPKPDLPHALAEWCKGVLYALNNPVQCTDWISNAHNRMQAFEKDVVLKTWKDLIEGLTSQN